MIAVADRSAAAERTRELIAASRPIAIAAHAPAGATDLELRQACRALYPKKSRRMRAAAVLAAMRMRSNGDQPMGASTLTAEQRDQVRDFVREWLREDASLSVEKLRKEANDRFGFGINVANFGVTYWKPVRVQLGMHKPRGRQGGGRQEPASLVAAKKDHTPAPATVAEAPPAPSPPVNRVESYANGTGPAGPASTHIVIRPAPTEAVQKRIEDLQTEITSLRTTYESDEFIRLEDQGGKWALRVYMVFEESPAAVRALARVSAGLAG